MTPLDTYRKAVKEAMKLQLPLCYTPDFELAIEKAVAAYFLEIVGEDEVKVQSFGYGLYYSDGAPERNSFRADLRSQIARLEEK